MAVLILLVVGMIAFPQWALECTLVIAVIILVYGATNYSRSRQTLSSIRLTSEEING